MTNTGLYLGKFAPFHEGHQYVVETALDEVDGLIVLIYDEPEVTDTPVTTRAAWIEELYPSVEVIIAWTGPTGTGYSDEMKRKHEKYIIDRLGGWNITHFYSSERYGDHISDALNAEDCRVDPDREEVPISGTAIRNNPYENREYVHPRVYFDILTTVAVVGGPSTGKTTLTEALADEHDTAWMPEYGRQYWTENNAEGRLTQKQLVDLIETHQEKEIKRATDADEYFFIDTNAVTTYTWCQYYHDNAPDLLYQTARDTALRYDYVVLCDTETPYEGEEGRSGPENRERLQKMHRAFFERHNIPYETVSGTVEERTHAVSQSFGLD